MSSVVGFMQEYRGVVLVLTVLAILAMEWAGRRGSLWLIDKAFGDKAAERYDTRWTAVGVIHHEFSHLLVALITGARIDGVQLYNFRRKEGEEILGYVNYTPRGLFLMRTAQKTLIGIAPGILGSFNVCAFGYIAWYLWQHLGWVCMQRPSFWLCLLLMGQIAYHACPSSADIKGSIVSISIFAFMVAMTHFSYFTIDIGVWVIKAVGLSVLLASAPAIIASLAFIIGKAFSRANKAQTATAYETRVNRTQHSSENQNQTSKETSI